jgi:hypothetical protein
MAMGIWKLACPKVDNNEDARLFATTLEDCSKRYIDVQIVSTATSGATGGGYTAP